MSMNNVLDVEQTEEPRSEDQESAIELVKEDEILNKDACAIEVTETWKLPNGQPVKNFEDFFIARKGYLMREIGIEKMSKIDPEMVRVVTGVRADLEKYIEGGK
jgi:hypothetical protein